MTQQVYIPQKQDDFGKLLGIGGAIAGTLLAPGVGTAAGAEAGALLTGAGAGMALGTGANALLNSKQPTVGVPTPDNAMQRRMTQIQPVQLSIDNGLQALQYMPKDLQKEYEPILLQARSRASGVA
jgi:hypothetical protein